VKRNTEEHRAYVSSKFPDAFELFYAVLEGSLDEVKSRLAAGDDPNTLSIDGITPIFIATRVEFTIDKAEALFSAGAVINRWNYSGAHPLHGSIWCARCVSWLLEHGADVNAPILPAKEKPYYPIGWTALHMAADHGLLTTTELLLASGADPNRQSQDGSTPLHVAARQPKLYKRLIRTLIDAGADVNAVNAAGNTPLHEVVSHLGKDAKPVARLLLFRGARVDTRNASGFLPGEMLPDSVLGSSLKSLFTRYISNKSIN
jgi:ankyrin repeat protein